MCICWPYGCFQLIEQPDVTSVVRKERNNQLAATLIAAYKESEKTQIKKKWNLASSFHGYCLNIVLKFIAMVKEDFRKVGLNLEDKSLEK